MGMWLLYDGRGRSCWHCGGFHSNGRREAGEPKNKARFICSKCLQGSAPAGLALKRPTRHRRRED